VKFARKLVKEYGYHGMTLYGCQIQQQDLGCLYGANGRNITVEGVFSLHTYSSVHSDGRHEFKHGGEAQKAERTYGYKVTCHQLRNQEPLATQPAPVRGMRL
jgi:hypothetical protein